MMLWKIKFMFASKYKIIWRGVRRLYGISELRFLDEKRYYTCGCSMALFTQDELPRGRHVESAVCRTSQKTQVAREWSATEINC